MKLISLYHLKHIKIIENMNTGMFTSVIDYNGEMICGFADIWIHIT